MKAVTNTVSTFLLLAMVLLMMQAVLSMQISERGAYSDAAYGGRTGNIADNAGVATARAYSAAGFNVPTTQPGLVLYSEAFPAPGLSNLSADLRALEALFNNTAGPDRALLSFQASASQPSFNIAPLNATLSYDSGNYTRITPVNAAYSSALVTGYNVTIRAACSNFSHNIMNMSNTSGNTLRLRIDLRCPGGSPFVMVYDVDKYSLTQIRLSEANVTIAAINVTSPAKLEVYKGKAMQLNITMSVAADPRVEAPSACAVSSGNFTRSGAVAAG